MNLRKVKRIVRAKSGFALISIILLMILLAILRVGMLGLSAVSVRNSSHDKLQAEAQANARMALVMALGRLQELAGDDRRVTATADIRMEEGSSHGSRYWTGVWRNTAGDSVSEHVRVTLVEAHSGIKNMTGRYGWWVGDCMIPLTSK